MESATRQEEHQRVNTEKWNVSRRKLLKIMAVAGVTAAVTSIVPSILSGDNLGAESGQDGAPQKRLRRWGMIIDLRYCDGCQSQGTPPQRTTACIEGHFVPEPMEWIEVFKQELPGEGTQFMPSPCMQCQNAPCVSVCPVGATWSTPEGIVLIDQNRCIGCRMCMAACPYDRRFFTWGKPPVPKESIFVEYSPEHQVPMKQGVVFKCDFCPEMARAGRLPFCAQGCPNGAIYYGDLEEDLATNGEQVVTFSKFLADNNAYTQKAELGTKPRVYYIPGHGEAVGRSPRTTGREPTEWRWVDIAKGAKKWQRSSR